MGKVLIVVGVGIAAIGVAIQLGLPLGRLPGDLSFRRGNATVYLPLATSLLVSVVLSLIFLFVRR